jgi:anti-anti-sigma factor
MVELSKDCRDDFSIILLGGYFQAEDGKEFRHAVEQEIERGIKNIIVDMQDLVYLDTPAIVSLLSARNFVYEHQGKICFVESSDNRVKQLLTTTRLNQILNFYPDQKGALEASRKGDKKEVYKEAILHSFLISRSPRERSYFFIKEVKKIREYLSLKEIEEDAELKRQLIDQFFHILIDALSQSVENQLLSLADDIIDSLPIGILAINQDGEIKVWNRAMEDITEINKERRLGRKILEEPLTPDIRFYQRLRQVLTTGESLESEDRFVSLGQEVVIHSLSKAIRDEAGNISGAIAILQDITTKDRFEKELERLVEERSRELEQAQEQLVQAEKLATAANLAARVAHEISNPLYGIKGALEIIAEDFPGDSQKKELLDTSLKEIQRISLLLNNILDFSRPQPNHFTNTDINKILEETLSFIGNELTERNVELKMSLSQNIPPIMVSADQLRQVFLNLIKNALEAMPEGGRLKVMSQLIHKEEDFVQIDFSDTGCGIPKDNLDKVFDPFFTTKFDNKGMGLGLAVTKDIIQRHGGTIQVKSEEQKGTTFSILLPVTPKNPLMPNSQRTNANEC